MLVITTQSPTFGRGFFLGFDKEGNAHFQSCYDHRVKTYKAYRNAAKQMARIMASPGADEDGTTYDIVSTVALIPAPGAIKSHAERLHERYGWPLQIYARGYDAHLVDVQPLTEGRVAPIYRFPGGDSLVGEDELTTRKEQTT